MSAVLELRAVTVAFGDRVANRAVDLRIDAGEVHAVVGENGAGKSTAMKVAYGEVRADAGEIVLKGEVVPRARHRPAEAIRRGVGMVHQHFMLVGPMTVAENVVLGREPLRGPPPLGLVDLERAARELAALSIRYRLGVDPRARVETLSVGEQQRVEILKVLWQGCDVLILDEPTAVLTPGETRELFGVLRGLVAAGRSCVLISHKLDEVNAIADRITVMRRGAVVAALDGRATPAAIARAMVGRDVLLAVQRAPAWPGEPVLEVTGLVVERPGGGRALDGVDLAVRTGEIVGVAAVEGNGQGELIEAIVGLVPIAAGAVRLGGRDLAGLPVADRLAGGIAHVPADRHLRGLVLDMSVAENLILGRQGELARGARLSPTRVAAFARTAIDVADIRPPDPAAPARGLSGGNQQKIVIARELGRPGARVLLAAQPTRGVDVGAIEQIHRELVLARDRGRGVLLVSADLAELTALSDRIVVLYRGRVAAVLSGPALADPDLRDRLGELMTGAAAAAPPPGAAA